MKKNNLIIYCDGGLGNRLNALISGRAIARIFNLNYIIHWPINKWCSAHFNDLFSTDEEIKLESLKNLKGNLNKATVLLHDEIASTALSVNFNSAYKYSSLEDFKYLAIEPQNDIFYYPALIPNWIPRINIYNEFNNLKFSEYISTEVKQFVHKTIGQPFYGIHLRRTDLNIGLTDLEVFLVAKKNSNKIFFVCSDDQNAERLASAHENVFVRQKAAYVQKQDDKSDWLALSADEDGRIYHGNIQRNRNSVIEAAIDLLILSHSQLVGNSGSTFQTMARNLAEHEDIKSWPKPPTFEIFPVREVERQLANQNIEIETLINIVDHWTKPPLEIDHGQLIIKMLDQINADNSIKYIYALAQIALRNRQYRFANILARELNRQSPSLIDPIYLLCESLIALGEFNEAKDFAKRYQIELKIE